MEIIFLLKQIDLCFVTCPSLFIIGNISLAIGLSIGGTFMIYLLNYLGDWRLFNTIIFATILPYLLIAPWVLDESVRWLGLQGNVDQCEKIIRKIAKMNGKRLDNDFFLAFKVHHH